MPLALPGCSTVVDVAAGVFGPGEVGGAVDAHVVYRLRPDCTALMARTIGHGYTVLTPLGIGSEIDTVPTLFGAPVEETGIFEGPVRTGQSIYRYIAPAASETWASDPVDVVAEVYGVRLDFEEGVAQLDAICGPLPVPVEADPTVPRLPPVNR